MKEGKVKSLAISHKNGTAVLKAGEKVTEKDVNNWDELVEGGHIEETKTASKPKKTSKPETKKS